MDWFLDFINDHEGIPLFDSLPPRLASTLEAVLRSASILVLAIVVNGLFILIGWAVLSVLREGLFGS